MADDQGSDERNVVDISEAKSKPRKEKGGGGQPPTPDIPPMPGKGALYRAVGLAIDRHARSRLPAFPRRFVVVEPAKGVRQVLEVDEETGVCEFVDLTRVRDAIMEYVTGALGGRPGYAWEARHGRDCAEHWCCLAPPVPEPPAVLWQAQEGLCFNRLPWPFEPDWDGTGSPTFDGLLGRLSNAAALRHWIGSLFVAEADRQQYVWVYGHGGDGKGALVRFLKRVLGRSFASKHAPARDDTHWTAGLVGKRLIVFPDSNAAGFPASGLFKSLTGGDPVDINPKYKAPYCAELLAKFMILSQAKPTLSSERSDMRRVIFCSFSSGPELFDSDFEAKLWKEGGAFLSTCIHNYLFYHPKHGPIATDIAELTEHVSGIEEEFEVTFDKYFEAVPIPPGGSAPGPTQFLTPSQMQQIFKNVKFDRRRQFEFLAWLERIHGVRKRSVKINGEPRKNYVGARARSPFEPNAVVEW